MDNERKAERASAILSDALVVGAFKAIRDRQIAVFTDSAAEDFEAREEAKRMLTAINQLEGELREAIDTEAIKQKGRHRAND